MLNESWLLPSLLNDYITFNFHLRTVKKKYNYCLWLKTELMGRVRPTLLPPTETISILFCLGFSSLLFKTGSHKDQLVLNSPRHPGWPPVPLDFTVQVLGLYRTQLVISALSKASPPAWRIVQLLLSCRLQASENQCPPLPSVTAVHLAADGADTLFRRPFIYCDIDF